MTKLNLLPALTCTMLTDHSPHTNFIKCITIARIIHDAKIASDVGVKFD